uniref:Uncharacterized protein n=1 Tax=viral metagenome TaxID=1070528 RepID=A0A6C0H6K2_9ZZZZ
MYKKIRKNGGFSNVNNTPSPEFKSVKSVGSKYNSVDIYNSKYDWDKKLLDMKLSDKKKLKIGYNPLELVKLDVSQFLNKDKSNNIAFYFNDNIPICIRRQDILNYITNNDYFYKCVYSNDNHLNFRNTMQTNECFVSLLKLTLINHDILNANNNNIDLISKHLFDIILNDKNNQEFYFKKINNIDVINKLYVDYNPNGYDITQITDFIYLKNKSNQPLSKKINDPFIISLYLPKPISLNLPLKILDTIYEYTYDLLKYNEVIDDNEYNYNNALTTIYNNKIEFKNIPNINLSNFPLTHHLSLNNHYLNKIITLPNITKILSYINHEQNKDSDKIIFTYLNNDRNISIDTFLTNSQIYSKFYYLIKSGIFIISNLNSTISKILSPIRNLISPNDYVTLHNIIYEMDTMFKNTFISENSLLGFQSVYLNYKSMIYGYDVYNNIREQIIKTFLILNYDYKECIGYEILHDNNPIIIQYILEDGIPYFVVDRLNKNTKNYKCLLLPRNLIAIGSEILKYNFINNRTLYIVIVKLKMDELTKIMYSKKNICKTRQVFDLL